MIPFLSVNTKRSIKGWVKQQRLRYIRWRYAFSPAELAALLRRLGVQQGDVILVHSAFNHFEGFTGKATDVIAILQDAVGPQGTLLMPTMPFTGTAIDFVRSGKLLDIKRTPSQMGMISELFRRLPEVIRSTHPTHPVAVWGAQAEAMSAAHCACTTPCGRQSPFGRLLDYNGRLLFLGASIQTMTFFHTLEEMFEAQMPFSPFTRETFELTSRAPTGELVTTRTRLFDPAISRRRNIDKLEPVLKEKGYWQEAHLGKLRVILLKAEELLKVVSLLGLENCYD